MAANGGPDIYDTVIVGGGPAGFTAGLYAARSRMRVVLIESLSVMGQLTMTDSIENYPGMQQVSGFELVSKMKENAVSFGLKCEFGTVKQVSTIKGAAEQLWQVEYESGSISARSVIVAAGASPKKLDVPGEKEFIGKGVSYCATCDGAFFRDKNIVVVGGGNSAIEEALFLTKFGKKVTVIHRRDKLRASKIVQERVFSCKKIDLVWESVVEGISGKEKVEKVHVKNIRTGEKRTIECDGVFIFAGWTPNTDFIKGLVKTAENGGIIVDEEMRTSANGIFACGDCCQRPLHQVVTACGDGAIAAFSAEKHVEKMKGTSYD